MSNVNRQATKLTQSLGNCLTPIQSNLLVENKLRDGQCNNLNGVVNSGHPSSVTGDSSNSLPGPAGDASSLEQSPSASLLDATCQAARCRPMRSYRKRKLLRTSGLHQVSRKAARLSTVKCQCSPPFSSCPMCGGRYNNSQTVDADTMPANERVSLLDPSYHPVLSFNEGKKFCILKCTKYQYFDICWLEDFLSWEYALIYDQKDKRGGGTPNLLYPHLSVSRNGLFPIITPIITRMFTCKLISI